MKFGQSIQSFTSNFCDFCWFYILQLEQKRSPLLRNVMQFLQELMKDYRNDVQGEIFEATVYMHCFTECSSCQMTIRHEYHVHIHSKVNKLNCSSTYLTAQGFLIYVFLLFLFGNEIPFEVAARSASRLYQCIASQQ